MANPLTYQQAQTEIQMCVRDTDFPLITSSELATLVARSQRADVNRNVPDLYPAWQGSTAYALGATVVPNPRNNCYYTVTVAGTSGTVMPTFPTGTNQTVTDGSVTWTCSGAALWTPTYNLAYGIRMGWQVKLGKLATAYDVEVGQNKLHRAQMFGMIQKMIREWGRRVSSLDQLELQGSLRDRRLFQNITNQNDELFVDGQIWWPGINGALGGAVPEYEIPRGYTGVSAGGQWIDP